VAIRSRLFPRVSCRLRKMWGMWELCILLSCWHPIEACNARSCNARTHFLLKCCMQVGPGDDPWTRPCRCCRELGGVTKGIAVL
jgi:hypothetical protein